MKNFEETLLLLERIEQLIHFQSTGTAKEFANKLGISRAKLFRLLAFLREKGKVIKYCDYRRTYFYEEN